jgi:hypothetical protein
LPEALVFLGRQVYPKLDEDLPGDDDLKRSQLAQKL